MFSNTRSITPYCVCVLVSQPRKTEVCACSCLSAEDGAARAQCYEVSSFFFLKVIFFWITRCFWKRIFLYFFVYPRKMEHRGHSAIKYLVFFFKRKKVIFFEWQGVSEKRFSCICLKKKLVSAAEDGGTRVQCYGVSRLLGASPLPGDKKNKKISPLPGDKKKKIAATRW